ncbi:MAG: hypothetical protein WCD37_12070 [Chloroflexia bacterium]
MNRAPRIRLANARIAGPIMVAAIFLFCSTFGMLVGLTVKKEHPRIEVLPVYPNAQSVSPLTPGRIGSLSTPTATPIALPTLLTNFTFSTTDTREQVLAYYLGVMEKDFGMQVQGGDPRDPRMNSTPGITVLRYGRAALYENWTIEETVVPSVWIMERVTITVDSQTPGITRGTVYLDAVPLPTPR